METTQWYMYKLLLIACVTFTSKAGALDPLKASMKISSYGMKAQQERIRIIAQNIANKDVTSAVAGGDPYRRQTTILNIRQDKELDTKRVIVKGYGTDLSEFKNIYDPSHLAANIDGYVKYPNVNINIENADSRDAVRSFEANLNMLDLSKNMYNKALDILR